MMTDVETTTAIKLENVCPHGLLVGYGAAPCPFCYPEYYQNVPYGPGPTDYGRKVGMTEAGELRLTLAAIQARLTEAERERDEVQAQLEILREEIRALEAWADPPEPGARHAAVWTEDIKAWCRDALGENEERDEH